MGRTIIEALGMAIKRSDYRALLARATTSLGFLADDEAVILKSDPDTMRMRFEPCASIRDAKVQAWAVVDKRRLLALDERTSLPVDVRAAGSTVAPPKLARIVQRAFQAPGTFEAPIAERRDLVFATMFGDDVTKVVGSTTGGLEILRFNNGMHGKDVVVTSGLSSPEKAPTQFFKEKDPRTIGAGYELIVLCDRGDPRLGDQLAAMLRVTAPRGTHLLPGEWIWLEGETIPDTDIGGFLLAPPTTFPDKFPVGGGVAYFTLFLPATPAEVQFARRLGVLEVTARMNQNGIRDFSPMRRASVPGAPPYEPPPPERDEGLGDVFDSTDSPMRFITALQKVLGNAPPFAQLQNLAPPMLLIIGLHTLDFDIDGHRVALQPHDPHHPSAARRFRITIDPDALLAAASNGTGVAVKVEMPRDARGDAARVVAVIAACFS